MVKDNGSAGGVDRSALRDDRVIGRHVPGFSLRFTLGYFLFLPPGGPAVLDLQEQGGTDWKRKRFPIGSY